MVGLGTIQVYQEIYQIGFIVTLVMMAITVLLFFLFRISQIISDITGRTKRKELKIREAGGVVSKKPEKAKRAVKNRFVQDRGRDTIKKKNAKESKPTESLNAEGGRPTEVLGSAGSAPTEVLGIAAGAGPEVKNAMENLVEKNQQQKEEAFKNYGTTEKLKRSLLEENIKITIIQEILLVHSEEIVIVM